MESHIKKAERHLQKVDPVMSRLIAKHGPCTLFAENSLVHKSEFHALVWAIINQQLSVASARSIETKLLRLHRKNEFTAKTISRLNDVELAACGLSRQKIRYLRELCSTINDRKLRLNELHESSNEQITKKLGALTGIGPWTIDMFLMFSLGRLDVLPLGDLALRKSFGQNYNISDPQALDEYHLIAVPWRPYRTVASWYLWASVD